MRTRVFCIVRACLILALLLTLALSGRPPATAQARTDAVAPTASKPSALIFIENVGQFADGARFQVRGVPQGAVWLAEDAIWLTIVGAAADEDARSPLGPEWAQPDLAWLRRQVIAIRLSFASANPHPAMEPFNHLETHVSFFTGSDPAKWRADVPAWGGVRYVDLYPGIDLELTGDQGWLVPRLVTRSGADLRAVRLRVEGVEAVAVDGDTLRLSTAAGDAVWPLLRAEGLTAKAVVQPCGAMGVEITMPFAPEDLDQPSAPVPYDKPSDLLYGTFLGGSDADGDYGSSFDVAVDGNRAAYVTGDTFSSDFPTTPGAFDPSYDWGDAFVVKLNASGSALEYATFLGGLASDQGTAIAVDGAGATYVTGRTQSSDFPTTAGAFDPSFNSGQDAFVVKLNPAGSALDYATYLGGGSTYGYGVAVDGSGAAYVTGLTYSDDFPTTPGAFDTSKDGDQYTADAFVVKLNAAGSALDYATFLGGGSGDQGEDIAVDGSGAAYVTGGTNSPDFPIVAGAFDPTLGEWDGFVAKLNAAGSALDYATFLGGSIGDLGYGIAVEEGGVAYVVGLTQSTDFPTTPGAFDLSHNGDWDAFVVKLNAAGSDADYATFLGGQYSEWGNSTIDIIGADIAVDGSGAVYVTGATQSPDFPSTCGAFDTSFNYGIHGDGFVAKLNAAGSALDYATFLGANEDDWVSGVAVDGSGAAYVVGGTESSSFPITPDAFDTTYNGNRDAFVVKLAMVPAICVYLPVMLRNY
jgi:hypothetical protein